MGNKGGKSGSLSEPNMYGDAWIYDWKKKELNSLMIYQSELQHKSVTTFYWSVFKSSRQVWVTLLMMIYTSHNLFITHALSKDTICWTVWSHCRGSSSLLFGDSKPTYSTPLFSGDAMSLPSKGQLTKLQQQSCRMRRYPCFPGHMVRYNYRINHGILGSNKVLLVLVCCN